MHNSSSSTRPLQPAGAPANSHHAWAAEPDACPDGVDGSCAALAVFNAGNVSSQVIVNLTSLRLGSSGIAAPAQLCGRNLWTRRPLVPTPVVDVFAPKVRGGPLRQLLCWRSAHALASFHSCRGTELHCTSCGARTTARRATRCSRRAQTATTADSAGGADACFTFFYLFRCKRCRCRRSV